MSRSHRKPAPSAKHRQPAASAKHRQPAASAKKVAKTAFKGAGFQRADDAGSSGRCAGARAGYPLSAMPVEAQYIVRAGVLAFALGVGAAAATTPGVAFAEPTDTSSSSSSSSTSSSSSESAASTSSTDPTSSTTSSASAAGSSPGSTSEKVQSPVDSRTGSTSSPRHASTADPRCGVVQSSGGAHTGSTPSSSDTDASTEATPTQTGVPSAVAAASSDEQPTAASPNEQSTAASRDEQPTAASLTEQPATPAPSAEPAVSLIALGGATPDATHGESRTAPNSAGSAPANRSGSASSTSANQQSAVVVRAAATPASTAEPRTAKEASVESVVSISSPVEGALDTQAIPKAFSDPLAPPNVVSDVVSKVLASVGLSPFASNNPVAPIDSPAMWAVLAWVRRRAEEAQAPSSFGRMFPVGATTENAAALEPLNQQTNQQLADLAQSMLEEEAIANPKGTTAGITFFGQFIDHDLTLDNEPQPTDTVDVEGLVNGRSFAFDLDSVYGGGPMTSPQLYDGDKFLIGTATDGVSPDLPRDPYGSAILVEPRNDENLIIAQMHLSFLRLHNSLVDQGMSFDEARQTVVGAYRYVVLNDYLPQIVGQAAVDRALSRPPEAGFYQPGSQNSPMTPVEFSTAAFRFGHSQVRNAYNISDDSGAVRVFSIDPTVPDLRGGRQLPENLIIDFDNFFSELPRDSDDEPALIGRAIDTHIAPSLFELPIPGAEATGSNVLAFRNLVRSKFYDVPSGEAIAGAMGVPVVGEPVFPEGTPLWYYILREAEMTTGGAELGPVGGGIVAEVFVDLLRLDSGYTKIDKPNLPDVSGGDFRIGDLLVAADQPQKDEPRPPAAQPRGGGEGRPILDPAQERPGRHRFHQQLHRADDPAPERSGRHRLHQQLHGADDPAPGRHRLYKQLHGADH
jgi:hypothetical protein